jgi:hypothetical protein
VADAEVFNLLSEADIGHRRAGLGALYGLQPFIVYRAAMEPMETRVPSCLLRKCGSTER